MKRSIIVAALLLLAVLLLPQISMAQELPPDLVAKLHTNLNIATLEDYDDGWGTTFAPLLPLLPYTFRPMDTAGLYGVGAYNVLIMMEMYYEHAKLTTEQINLIVEFVRGGGGVLILSYSGYIRAMTMIGGSLDALLEKLGINIKGVSETGPEGYMPYEVIVKKDGKMMVDHPITVDVEQVKFGVYYPVVAIESNGDKFIIYPFAPFVALAKEYGAGRVVFLGHGGYLYPEFSGMRLMVNMIEWVAGYTPPGWSPSVDSIVGSLREENAELKELLSGYDELKASYDSMKATYDELKADYDSLKAGYDKLQSDFNSLDSSYKSLQADYNELKSEYDDLKSRYEEAIPPTTPPTPYEFIYLIHPELTYVFIVTTIVFIATTIYFARRKQK